MDDGPWHCQTGNNATATLPFRDRDFTFLRVRHRSIATAAVITHNLADDITERAYLPASPDTFGSSTRTQELAPVHVPSSEHPGEVRMLAFRPKPFHKCFSEIRRRLSAKVSFVTLTVTSVIRTKCSCQSCIIFRWRA